MNLCGCLEDWAKKDSVYAGFLTVLTCQWFVNLTGKSHLTVSFLNLKEIKGLPHWDAQVVLAKLFPQMIPPNRKFWSFQHERPGKALRSPESLHRGNQKGGGDDSMKTCHENLFFCSEKLVRALSFAEVLIFYTCSCLLIGFQEFQGIGLFPLVGVSGYSEVLTRHSLPRSIKTLRVWEFLPGLFTDPWSSAVINQTPVSTLTLGPLRFPALPKWGLSAQRRWETLSPLLDLVATSSPKDPSLHEPTNALLRKFSRHGGDLRTIAQHFWHQKIFSFLTPGIFALEGVYQWHQQEQHIWIKT